MAADSSDEDTAPSGGYGGAAGRLAAAEVAEEAATQEAEKDSDEYSLAQEFYDAYKAFSLALRSDSETPEQKELDALLSQLKGIAYHVMKLRLFSPNEELDDINTTDLKYLLVPYLLAEVTAATRDIEDRIAALRRALLYWRAFAADCHRLKVAHADDIRAIDRSPEDALDPASKRDEKIARYKRTKELDEKVAYLFAKKKEGSGDEYLWGAGSAFDEEMERDLVLALLRRAVSSVPDSITSAEQELPMLEMMMARGGPGKGPKQPPPPAEKPFIVRIQDRAELERIYRDMVFQCPHALPTITLEEAADADMAEMQAREAEKAERERYREAEEADRWWHGDRYGAKEEADEEQKLYKDRDFDAFKDDNPWGSGNKMANIG
eukprot:TRINITY_DN79752_c0_g1_i1.p1 TRINITY_DN79752_c0_g1~~TRINITY_DN79752_c0_g1_i1.p1  ORF type:complete len:412 (+),score=122.00 TRINITY_DN79752_c0_g1_i1:99-1238(+)